MHGLGSISAHLQAFNKAGVRWPILILMSPLWIRAFECQISQDKPLYKYRLLPGAFRRKISKTGHYTSVGWGCGRLQPPLHG